jgi:alkylated DNA repair protein (DNA oxidative demethylase)
VDSLFDDVPGGFLYRPDFITAEEEAALLRDIEAMTFSEVRMRGVAARRRVRQFGWHYSFDAFSVREGEAIPTFLLPVRTRAAALANVDAEALSEALVTEYREGATIGWHRDAPMFGVIVGLSLRAPCVFKLRRGDESAREKPISVPMAPRSAYELDGEARRDWQHSIPAVKALRYSITFRTLRRTSRSASASKR